MNIKQALAKADRRKLARQFELLLKVSGIEGWKTEYRFHPARRWPFDYAWPNLHIAVELDGGTWVAGRHVQGKGYAGDCEKFNQATLLGWHVLHFTTDMLFQRPFECMGVLRELLAQAAGARNTAKGVEP